MQGHEADLNSLANGGNYFEGFGKGAGMSLASSAVSYGCSFLTNIPGALPQGAVSAAAGFASSAGLSYAFNGSVDLGSASFAGITGGIMGGIEGYNRATENGLNPWTGRSTAASRAEFHSYNNLGAKIRAKLTKAGMDAASAGRDASGLFGNPGGNGITSGDINGITRGRLKDEYIQAGSPQDERSIIK